MRQSRSYSSSIRLKNKKRSRFVLLNAVIASFLAVAAISIIGPLTYDERAYHWLDASARSWSRWGDQVFGLDITAPRQNIFSLIRDLDRTTTIVDHSTVYSSRLMGLANWVGRGSVYTVADALQWFRIPLTTNQARALDLCNSLDSYREGESIVIQPDAWQYGIASWYGPGFHGRLAASGEIYNMYDRTAAHKTLPLQSLIRVVSQRTGQSIVVRINDRGPYVGGRVIDMSYRAKELLGMGDLGAVYLERLDPTAFNGGCE